VSVGHHGIRCLAREKRVILTDGCMPVEHMPRRWFISYHSPDGALAEQLKNAIKRKDPGSDIFFAPSNLRVGGFWSAQLAQAIADATAFVLLVGSRGIGNWQVLEYDEALDKRVKSPAFPVMLVLLEGQAAPGLPFLRQLHWIVSPDPASEKVVAQLLDATGGDSSRPGELWRYASPYRGLAAMEQKDSDYFFGRSREIVEVIETIAGSPDKISILLGNSGVGKSSLAQAGVLAALIRQAWPEAIGGSRPWPAVFQDSRRWCVLTLRPGTEPVSALVEAFLDTWQLDRTNTDWPVRRTEWVDKLVSGALTLRDLLDQTKRRYTELQFPEPASFLVYVDQGEELYVRSEINQRRRFSELLRQGISDKRIHALMSMRSDFLGELQKDEPLYAVHRQINVPPMRRDALLDLVSRPAELLSASFETATLAADIASRAADESTKDAGALPLLSYLLDDMWKRMVERGDGVLRLPAQSIDLGRVLVDRANAFLESHPNAEDKLRRILTLKLATVREDGEPTRRRAWRSEFSSEEWRLVNELADHPNRLLTTVTPDIVFPTLVPQLVPTEGETYAEVAHEAIFRRWEKLRGWIAAEREFLAWRSALEFDRRAWQAAPSDSKRDALLMGLPLKQAQSWLVRRRDDIPAVDRGFIELSNRTARLRRLRVQAVIGALVLALAGGLLTWWQGPWLKEQAYRLAHAHALGSAQALALEKGTTFSDCSDCPKMIVVPNGDFWMGSPAGQGPGKREQPQHQVTIAQPFAVSIHEVTFDEWDKCATIGDCNANINAGSWGRGKQPVINVTWRDAQRYTNWLSRITGQTYRLLTEAEWEYAARARPQSAADEQTLYSFGNDDDTLLKKYAWYADGETDGPHPVGEKKANPFGLYDMNGNVWEWVEDCFREGYAPTQVDGAPWKGDGDNCGRRVIRGGSFRYGPSVLRSASRDQAGVDTKDDDRGFRVARQLK
jgi:formylglycine-generating enzyme required for sulfatase activity